MGPLPSLLAILLTTLGSAAHAQLQSQPVPLTRGALLYETHCNACHTEKMHWRANRRARDWNSLRELVRQWQFESRLDWGEDDIEAVTRHLNDTIYQYAPPDSLALHRP